MAGRQRRGGSGRFGWHRAPVRPQLPGGCRRVEDSGQAALSALEWLGGDGRDPGAAAELRATSLVRANEGLLRDFRVEADVRRVDGQPVVWLRTSTRIGAIPLVSPVTGRADFGLVVEPRFPWAGLGDVLTATGFRVVPSLLPLPDLPQSDRRIPPWVLSSIVLVRLEQLLDRMARRFTVTEADVRSPRGAIDWRRYACARLPVGRVADVPCRYPDLRDDEELRAAIHHVLQHHRAALSAQRGAGLVVLGLLATCERLVARVAGTPPRRPSDARVESWRRQPVPSRVFREGLQAIEWTVEERGLAGLSDLAGLSWRMDMEVFFEAWVERLGEQVARRCGATMRCGRRGQTAVPLEWEPPWVGSQRALVPDVVVERPDVVLVLDAKYKAHAEEIAGAGWGRADDVLREHHRADVHQVLAYSTLFAGPRVVACLVYPCLPETFTSLKARGRLVTRARVPAGERSVELALAVAPMGGDASEVVEALSRVVAG